MKWNNDAIDQYIKDNNFNIKRLSDYVSINEKMSFQCNCGNKYYTSWHNVKDKRSPKIRCDICGNKLKGQLNKITIQDINKYISDNNLTCVLVSNEIKDVETRLTFKCECGKLFYTNFSNLKHIQPYCKSCRRKHKELVYFNNFKHSLEAKLKDDLVLLSYADNKLHLHCNKCDNDISIRMDHFNEGQRCPICSRKSSYSNGEVIISNFLKQNNINYIPQYKFEDCKDIRSLPFDFYLPDYRMCIEFDGEQHFKLIDHFGGEEAFKIRQKHDKIKDDYCRKNCIKLLRISFSEINNIENILYTSLIREEVI